MEEKAVETNVTVDTFSPQRNESEDIIDKVANLTNKKSWESYY